MRKITGILAVADNQALALYKEGVAAAKAGDTARAHRILKQASELAPENENIWLWLAGVTPVPEEALHYLERVLEINPTNPQALKGVKWAQGQIAQAHATAHPAKPKPAAAANAPAGTPSAGITPRAATHPPAAQAGPRQQTSVNRPTPIPAPAGKPALATPPAELRQKEQGDGGHTPPVQAPAAHTPISPVPQPEPAVSPVEPRQEEPGPGEHAPPAPATAAPLDELWSGEPSAGEREPFAQTLVPSQRPPWQPSSASRAAGQGDWQSTVTDNGNAPVPGVQNAPVAATASHTPVISTPAPAPAPAGKPIVLIVDDSPTIRKLVAITLEKHGYTVIAANDGLEGLSKMGDTVPALILLDITMPRLDGYQLCKLIKGNPQTQNIPVIMLSGKDGFFDKVRGRIAGSTEYITKPFEPDSLLQVVRRHTGRQ